MLRSPFRNKGLISLAAGNVAKSALRCQRSLWIALAEQTCFSQRHTSFQEQPTSCDWSMWQYDWEQLQRAIPALELPQGWLTPFGNYSAAYHLPLLYPQSSLCPKGDPRALLIHITHANFSHRDYVQGTQPGTLTTAYRNLHYLGSAYLSNLSHFNAPFLLPDTISFFGFFTALPLKDLCLSFSSVGILSWLFIQMDVSRFSGINSLKSSPDHLLSNNP